MKTGPMFRKAHYRLRLYPEWSAIPDTILTEIKADFGGGGRETDLNI
jgi:hypothetical protein